MSYPELVSYVNGLIALDAVVFRDGIYKIHIAVDVSRRSIVDAILRVYGPEAKISEMTTRGNTAVLKLDIDHLIMCTVIGDVTSVNCKVLIEPIPESTVEMKRSYMRGVFDRNGIVKYHRGPVCCVSTALRDGLWNAFVENAKLCVRAVPVVDDGKLLWTDHNAIDFMTELYSGEGCRLGDNDAAYREILKMDRWPQNHRTRFIASATHPELLEFKFTRVLKGSPAPYKARASDAGFDLHLVRKVSEQGGLHVYGTGIAVQPPFGYYFEIVGRSSISKTGYMLANSFGVIDCSYTGEIMVGLRKVLPDAAELLQKDIYGNNIPLRMIQLIPRKLTVMSPVEVDDLSASDRGGSGGLGADQFKGN